MRWLLSLLLKKGLRLAVLGGVVLALAEGVLVWVTPAADTFLVWPPHLRRTFLPDPLHVPGVRGSARFQTNGDGLRGAERTDEDSFLVLALGGSTTECLYLDQEESWPMLVQRRLNAAQDGQRVWVGNGGRSGASTREHLLQLPRLLETLPSLDVLVLLAGGNDLCLRLARDEEYDPRHLDRPEAHDRLMRRSFAVYPGRWRGDATAPFYKRTYLWILGRALRDRVAVALGLSAAPQQSAGEQYRSLREWRRACVDKRPDLPDLAEGLAEYRRNLGRLMDLAAEQGCQVLCLTQPALWREDLPAELEQLLWFGWVGTGAPTEPGAEYYQTAALARGLAAYNDVTRQLCAERGTPCVDLAARLPGDDTALYDDLHFNERGASLVAAGVVDALLPLVREAPDSR